MVIKIASDFAFLRAGVQVLPDYLLSKDLYWTLAGVADSTLPSLTLSGLSLAYVRLSALELEPALAAELRRLEIELGTIQTRWRVAWERKAASDFRGRLTIWRNFLQDLRGHPEANADRYAYEVGRRVQLDLLVQPPRGWPAAADVPQVEQDLLIGLDSLLKAIFIPGAFVWDDALAAAFPAEIFWYLYGRPKSG